MFEGNEATKWGEANEPFAIDAYVLSTATGVNQVGFIRHPEIDWIGGSPDGLTDADKVVEIKCPFSQNAYDDVPPHYMAQIQGLMEITGRPLCDLAVWTPGLMRVFTVERSANYWGWMYPRLAEFWAYFQAGVEPPRAKKSSFDFTALVLDRKDYLL